MMTVAVIGLGNMGGPMAANLAKAGYEVKGFDLVARCNILIAHQDQSLGEGESSAIDLKIWCLRKFFHDHKRCRNHIVRKFAA